VNEKIDHKLRRMRKKKRERETNATKEKPSSLITDSQQLY
jgi:hypothetical protein